MVAFGKTASMMLRILSEENLEKISKAEMETIAEKVKSIGIETEIYA